MVKLAQSQRQDQSDQAFETQIFEAFYPNSIIKSEILLPPDDNIKGQQYIAIDKTEVYWGKGKDKTTDSIVVKLINIQIPFKVDYDLVQNMNEE